MKLYLAGTTVSNPDEYGPTFLSLYNNKLHSFYHCRERGGLEFGWWNMNKGKVDLFLDSGAFSAFTQGVDINIKEYIAFIKEHQEHLAVYANLDVIGDAAGTYKNQCVMERAGLNPLPCFHYGEDIKWLERYLAKHDSIALGGMVPISTKNLQVWLDTIFRDYICDADGMPKVKVHGFGMTSHKLMWRYPWWSVDSTSWVVTGRLGSIYVPRFRGGEWDHTVDAWKVAVSERSPNKGEAGKHISTFSRMERAVIQRYLDSKGFVLGRSEFRWESEKHELEDNERWVGAKKDAVGGKREVERVLEVGLGNTYQERDKLNIMYFLDLEAAFPPWPWPLQLPSKRKGFGLR